MHRIAAAISSDDSSVIRIMGIGMNDNRIAAERADIERRVAKFRATQAQFQREREA